MSDKESPLEGEPTPTFEFESPPYIHLQSTYSLTEDIMKTRHMRVIQSELRLHRYLIMLGFAIVIVMLAVIALAIGQLP